MRVARICRAKHPDLDGKGAAMIGGRWNSPGTRVVYTCSCGALAVLEYRVHASEDPGDLRLYTIEVPDALKVEVAPWTPDIRTSRGFGDVWVNSRRSAALAVPSVVVPRQINYLLNPEHPDFVSSIKIIGDDSFALDVRLFDLTGP